MRNQLITLLTLSLGFVASIANATPNSPYPFHTGTKWVYATSEGPDVTLLVEGRSPLRVNDIELEGSLVRRSDGSDRIVFRSKHQWFECGSLRALQAPATCHQPLQFFQWPLEVGSTWSGGNMDFVVMAKESVTVPFGTFPESWKVAYMPRGGKDPMGEMWIVEGIGRVRILEREVSFDLLEFERGQGTPLTVLSKQSLDLIERGYPRKDPSRTAWTKLKNLLSTLQKPWLLVFMTLLIAIASMIYLGLGLRKAIESRVIEEDFSSTPDPQEEAKLLASVARSGNFQKARKHFESLIEENPTYPDLRFQLGLMLRAEGKLDEARKQFEQALQINGQYIEARLALAHLLLGIGDHEQAVKEFDEVLMAQPEYADAHVGRGKALLHLAKISDAILAFERALEINPQLNAAQQFLAQCRKNAQNS